ncbi:hypothetical protein [Stenoxybacter acetivorans]|uniref:hypothetical protein n=1 Tax=Stenoxybacter acetivorans TaxID=422441 RepID=UPI0012EB198A|nr:hypothetical protein [Stenoxybacter acetivorans]
MAKQLFLHMDTAFYHIDSKLKISVMANEARQSDFCRISLDTPAANILSANPQ